MSTTDNRYRQVCARFITFTTPVYLAFFIVLWLIRYYQYDDFSNGVLLTSMGHMALAEFAYFCVYRFKPELNKHNLFGILWAMVFSNIILFCYWIVYLDNTRVLMYMLAPMSCVALFSIATFKQAISFNIFQTFCLLMALLLTKANTHGDTLLYSAGLDMIYITVLLIMCVWLSSIAAAQARMKSERDAIVHKFRGMAKAGLESNVVDNSAEKLSGSSQQSAAIAATQQKAAEQLSTTVEELSANAEQNAEQARKTLLALKKTESQVIDSRHDINELVESIDSVRDSGEKIKRINAVIDDIAYQTNLLSLNAMIEASRSGDEGSGFKVVALEVRKLAERAAESAKDINELLTHNRASIENGVALSAQTLKSFESIQADIMPLATAMQSVADASHEQSYSINHLSSIAHDIEGSSVSIQQLADDTKLTATALKQSAKTVSSMLSQLA
jgi:uncharacterized coiled-coil protein SlyX